MGAHPLTGSHRSGWRASRANLFDDARVFLCPTPDTSADTLRLAESFWRALRSGVEVLDAAAHDEEMSWRSHLPQVLSTTLALTLREAGVQRSALGPGGRDMTRLAGSSPSLWMSIVQDNTAALVHSLVAMESQLRTFRESLQSGRSDETRALLDQAREWFDGAPMEVSQT